MSTPGTQPLAAATGDQAAGRPTVLVTGATGFTGRYVCRALLHRGWRVAGLAHELPQPAEAPTAGGAGPATAASAMGRDTALAHEPELYVCELLDRARLREVVAQVRPTHVLHLAAIAFVQHGDVDAIYRTNVVGTRNLLDVLAASGAPLASVLLASSANVYGNTSVDPIDETVPFHPENDYAVSKVAMELMARLWLDRLPITIARPFNYTGVGQSENFLLPKIVSHFARGDAVIELGNIDVERDFSDVRTVADSYCRLLEKAPAGQAFNLCSGTAVSLRSVLERVTTIAGRPIEVRVNPAFVRANDVRRLRGTDARLRASIGEPLQIDLDQTLRWMFESFSEQSQ